MSLIAGLEGTLEAKRIDSALVRVGGVTFEVWMSALDLASLPARGSTVRLLTHLIVRDDDLLLYGFLSEHGRSLFEQMLGISNVGPAAALAILSVLPPEELSSAILAGDYKAISRARKVGDKTAQRIILELKGKIEDELISAPVASAGSVPVGTAGDPALAFLLDMGYSALEARQALSVQAQDGLSVDERVRRALQRLGQMNA